MKKTSGENLTDRLAEFFRRRPNEWIDGDRLRLVAGKYAWRTRLSELRFPPYHMDIVNRPRTVTAVDIRFVDARNLDLLRAGDENTVIEVHGDPRKALKRFRISEYRFVPDRPAELAPEAHHDRPEPESDDHAHDRPQLAGEADR